MKHTWWKESVVYQVYPRSFADSDGDGIGDLRGVIGKLDYLKTLGIDVVWLSPVYRSPNDDNGYDISDYQAIMAEFGTMADLDELLAGLHQRGIRLVMDLVINHSSDEHPWFVESRSSKENPYREYYIWRPGKYGREPNNWASFFSGSAWQYDALTDAYFLHLFSTKQPDLNWESPALRAELYAMMTWWLDKGVDGFRMDVINLISKTPGLPDAPERGDNRYHMGDYAHGPRLLEFLDEMKREVLAKYDIVTVGETPGASPADALAITHEEHGSLNMVFQFEHMGLDIDASRGLGKWASTPWSLRALKQTMTRWQTELAPGGWNSLYLSNHDQPRALSRFGDDRRYRVESAKLLATFNHTLQGTPYIYQGEELGMTNVAFETIADYRDIETLNMYREFVHEREIDPQEVMAMIAAKGRDNARTPMQWDASANAGFSSGTPWIKVNPNYALINAAQQVSDPDSVFAYYQRLIGLRRTSPVLVYGSYALLEETHEQIYAYSRTTPEDRLLIVLNFSAETPLFAAPPALTFTSEELLIANYAVDAGEDLRALTLKPYEARVYRLR